MKRLRWAACDALAIALLLLGLTLFASLTLGGRALSDPVPPGSVIVVLGGDSNLLTPDLPGPGSVLRARSASALWQPGQRVVFTGSGPPGAASVSETMADLAVRLGVPKAVIQLETRSRSTAQNALFARPLVGHAPIILVSEPFHLPRAWVTFRLAGFEVADVSAPPERFEFRYMLRASREVLAWAFNAVRGPLWVAAPLFGVKGEQRDTLLS